MITVDISNVWGQLALPDLLAMEKEVADAYSMLMEGTGAGSEYLGWMDLPLKEETGELRRILDAAEKIRRESDVCVVVGIGGSCLGARAAVELLQGPNRNIGKAKGDPQIFFAGNSLSTRHWNELTGLLREKDFSVVVISKSGTTLEPAVAFRGLRWMLERKYGTDEANRRIYAVTDPCRGALRQMAEEEGWQAFSIPPSVGGRYGVLTAVGLLPMAVAGIDILALMAGAAEIKEACDLPSYDNPVWLYAAVRNLLYRSGKAVELLAAQEPGFRAMGQWWQKLFAESEGKEGKGLLPVPVELTADLHSLGQLIQQGQRNLFETVICFDPPEQKHIIGSEWKNPDGLSYLEGRALDEVEAQVLQAAVAAHVDGGTPVICVDCGTLDAAGLGGLFYFMELSCAVSAYVLGVNPFNQPGVEPYKRNMFRLLGRPGYEI